MSRESFMNRETKHGTPSHERAPKQEKELAKRYGGKCTPASGAKDMKGDVRIHSVMRIEAKTTKHRSFSVTMDMLDKIEAAALPCGEAPALVIEFCTERGVPLREVAVVPTYVLDGLIQRAKNG